MSAFADDNFTIRWHRDLEVAKLRLEMSLAVIISWLSKSGLKVNANKTEICHFSRNDHLPINISINGDVINTKPTINVLGVIFDSKLQWGPQVTATITKASRALNAIRLIQHYFTQQELLQLITSNFYSVLFYNSEVWHLNTLKQSIKNSLLSISAKAIKVCAKTNDNWLLSFPQLHEMAGRATPEKLMQYKLALQLYRTFNDAIPTQDWTTINFNAIFTTRQTKFAISNSSRLKVGMNKVSNRFHHLNNKIELNWLNMTYGTYKINCKKLFLS